MGGGKNASYQAREAMQSLSTDRMTSTNGQRMECYPLMD